MASRIMSTRLPVVIILGATGTGKTKLGVELAQKFGTEIISADSMQIYKGLDVVTAKASQQERQLVRHHLLDILEPHQNFTVVDFRNRALKIIENLTSENKMPIVVGGTLYYLESIVYKILVEKEETEETEALLWDKSRRKRDIDDNDDKEGSKKLRIEDTSEKKILTETKDHLEAERLNEVEAKTSTTDTKDSAGEELSIDKEKLQEFVNNETNFTNEEILEKLKAIDPVMAKRLHPNNRRKILRAIEVWLETGKRYSQILDDQKSTEGQLRRPGATIIFWLKCEQEVHEERLNTRIDKMLEDGLIKELLDFHDRHNKQRIKDGKPPDYTKGIFQTLGFKEFHKYLMMTEEQRNSTEGKNLLQHSIEYMKIGTRRYARRQNKMVRGRFLEHPNRQVPPIYELDTTDVSKWDENVKNKAIMIIESYLNGTDSPYKPLDPNDKGELKKINSHSNNFCEQCQRIIIGDKEFAIHMKSNRHKLRVSMNQMMQEKEENKESRSSSA